MANQMCFRYRDFDNDPVQTSINVRPAITSTEAAVIGIHLNGWSAGGEGGQFFKDEMVADLGIAANDPIAQGALRVVLEFIDDVSSKPYKEFLPMPNLGKAADGGANPAWVVSGGLTIMNPAHADYIAMKADLDAAWESPDGNTGTLSRAYIEE